MSNQIFALDIGTQSVTGIILEKKANSYTLIDYCMKEHNERAMLDGQIHHVVHVSEVIEKVKNSLENKHGKLTSVSVAAAGRALKTVQAEASIPLHMQPITKDETIKHLELSAVQKAQEKLIDQKKSNEQTQYYCVGYSVLYYKLDDQQIGSLIDQSGDKASVEIIATFLPKVVVESLLASLHRADLQMDALTLEPIAAINVLIPDSMRRLNIALVDIGAGTSDIAITNQGTVAAYGMVPYAGDAITEAMSDHYLLDFPKAEQAKRNIVNNGEANIQDILGFETTITYNEAVQAVTDNIDNLAHYLAEEIYRLNQKAPQAIMLIGGGSLTPEISTFLAQKMQLPENRVAVRHIDAIQNVNNIERLPTGPDFITPIGIAIISQQNPVHYVTVTVNDQTIRLFEMKQLTVGDCLIQAGIDINKQYGRPGLAYMITMNNKEMTLPGQFGQAPVITLNGTSATVESNVQDGDVITIKKGTDGKEPTVTISELLDEFIPLAIVINNKSHTFYPTFYVNERKQHEHYILQDKDALIIDQPTTIEHILTRLHNKHEQADKPFTVTVNNKIVNVKIGQTIYLVNDKQVPATHTVNHNDHLQITYGKQPTVADILQQLQYTYWRKISVQFNDEHVTLKRRAITIKRNGELLNEKSVIHLDDHLEIQQKDTKPFIFQDVFRYVNINLEEVKGHYELYKNEAPTTFYEQIQNGDQLVIR